MASLYPRQSLRGSRGASYATSPPSCAFSPVLLLHPHGRSRISVEVAQAIGAAIAAPATARAPVQDVLSPVVTTTPPTPSVSSSHSAFSTRYALGQELGRGSSGHVYAALDMVSGSAVAVKIVPKQRYAGRAQKAAMTKESTLWRRACIASVQAAKLIDVQEDFQNFYIVQERCFGGSLQSHLDTRGGLTEQELGEIAFCTLSFLSDMHSQSILYGDMKPGNIILQDTYPCRAVPTEETKAQGCMAVKVVDFGSSQLVTPSQPLRTAEGTPFFAAPEVVLGSYSLPADMWAFGVTLFTLVSRKLPFWLEPISEIERMDVDSLYTAILYNPVYFIGSTWNSYSEELQDLICKLLEKDASKRLTAQQAMAHPWFGTIKDMCALP